MEDVRMKPEAPFPGLSVKSYTPNRSVNMKLKNYRIEDLPAFMCMNTRLMVDMRFSQTPT